MVVVGLVAGTLVGEVDDVAPAEPVDVAEVVEVVDVDTEDVAAATTLPGVHSLQGVDQSMTPWSPNWAGRGLPVTSTTSPMPLKL